MAESYRIRLELQEGTSDKFWEITQTKAEVLTCWGRRGTAGQSQQKSFVSAAEARQFAEKQVAAKKQKGYHEVVLPGRDTYPIPKGHDEGTRKSDDVYPQTSESRPPILSLENEPLPDGEKKSFGSAIESTVTIAWTPRLRTAKLTHTRDKTYKDYVHIESLPNTPQEALKGFQAKLRQRLMDITCSGSTALKAHFDEARQLAGTPHGTEHLSLEAAAVALAVQSHDAQPLVSYLFLKYGSVFLLQALWQAQHVLYEYVYEAGRGYVMKLTEQPAGVPLTLLSLHFGQIWFHHWLRDQAPDAPLYQDTLNQAKTLWNNSTWAQKVLLAFLFSCETAWAEEVIQHWQNQRVPAPQAWGQELLEDTRWWQSVYVLWPQMAAHPLKVVFIERFQALKKNDSFKRELSDFMAGWAWWLLEYHAAQAVETLGVLIRDGVTAECRKNAAEALQKIPTLPTLIQMGQLLHIREGQKYFPPVLQQHPQMAIEALQAVLKKSPRYKEAQHQLDNLQRLHPEPGDDKTHVSIPTVQELPEWLQQAPWRQSPLKVQTPKRALQLRIESERIEWLPEDRQTHLQPYVHQKPPASPRQDKERLEKLKTIEPGCLELDELDRLTQDAAMAFFNGLLDTADGHTYNVAKQQKAKRMWQGLLSEWQLLCTLTRFGTAILPGLMAIAWEKPTEVFPVLARIVSPRLAFTMAQALQVPAVRKIAWQWLQKYRHEAVMGLLPVALGMGPHQSWAAALLRRLSLEGWLPVLQQVAQTYGEEASSALTHLLAQPAWADVPPKIPPLPDFWEPRVLQPPLLNEQGALPPETFGILGQMMALSEATLPYPCLLELKKICTPESLANWAWSVAQLWLDHGAPAKHEWMFLGLGHLGNDVTVRQLQPLIAKWPGERAHQRAVLGLEVLRQIGSVTAWAALHELSMKSRFPALKQAALQTLRGIAEIKGWRLEQLLDQLVPDFGLDHDHQRTFVLSSHPLRLVVDAQLRVCLQEPDGTPLRKVASAFKTAEKEWKTFQKDLEKTLYNQSLRLEEAMVQQQHWPVSEFVTGLQQHPVLGILVKRLLWQWQKDAEFKLFRVSEGQWLDVNENSIDIPVAGSVSLAHPVWIQPHIATWQAYFQQAQIEQPFAQLFRPVYFAQPEDYVQIQPPRWGSRRVLTSAMRGLSKQGWQEVYEGETEKCFGDYRVQIWTEYARYGWGDYNDMAIDVRVFPVAIHEALPPAALPPVVFSEILLLLSQLVSPYMV